MGSQLFLNFLLIGTQICLSSTLPSEYSIVENDNILELSSHDIIPEIFQRWMEKHQKVYKDKEEEEKRLDNFKWNLKYVIEKNRSNKKLGLSYQVGVNKFADVSNEEFRQKYLAKVNKPINKDIRLRSSSGHGNFGSCEAPSSLDWRKYGVITGVKDQGECGSCWAFSSTGAIEGINAINSGDLVSLSEQELIDCDPTNYGCEGGYMDYAFEWVISNGGIDSEAAYPYTGNFGFSGKCNIAKKEAKVVSIDGYLDVAKSDNALLCATVQQPISVGMDGSAIDFQLYSGGIYDGECSDNPTDIDHAVLIVGYGTEDGENYWICKNSWGTSWGMEGYFYLKRDPSLPFGVCAVNAMASYPTQVHVAPSPTSPPPLPPPPPSPPPPPIPIFPPPPPPSPPVPIFPPPPPPSPPIPIFPPPPPPSPPIPIFPPPPPPSPPIPIFPPPPPPSPPVPISPPPPPPPPPIPIFPPPPPPPPSPPFPVKCGDFTYCPADETCCCIFERFDFCLIYDCCPYENAVCCKGSALCCPHDFPVCDVEQGLCLQGHGDSLGILAEKRHIAKYKFPWSMLEEGQRTSQQLQWRRNQFAAVR